MRKPKKTHKNIPAHARQKVHQPREGGCVCNARQAAMRQHRLPGMCARGCIAEGILGLQRPKGPEAIYPKRTCARDMCDIHISCVIGEGLHR